MTAQSAMLTTIATRTWPDRGYPCGSGTIARHQAMRNRVVERLIVAELEVQERMLLDRAPVAAEQGVRADEIDGARDPAPVALGHHQEDAVAHLLADDRIERAREIGSAPFARAGLHVEVEEGVPNAFGEIRAREPVHADAWRKRLGALAANGFSLAGGKRGEEGVERGVAGILQVELAMGALQV